MLRTLVNVNPASELRTFEEVFDRMFGAPFRPTTPSSLTLPVDITERGGTLYVKAAVPGVPPEDLDVSIENGVLTIRGETKNENTQEGEKVYRREVAYGAFSRSIRLPEDLDLENVNAEFNNGFVTVSIPRVIEQKPEPKRIPVRSAQVIESPSQS